MHCNVMTRCYSLMIQQDWSQSPLTRFGGQKLFIIQSGPIGKVTQNVIPASECSVFELAPFRSAPPI